MRVATLIKFGQRDHLEAMRLTGVLYMNTLEYFWRIEDGDLRGDPFDSVESVHRWDKGTVELRTPDGRSVVGQVTEFEYREHTKQPETINLFCMYALGPDSFPVDDRNFKFGGHALILLEPQAFIEKTHQAVREERRGGRAGLVEYMPENYAGDIGPFRKRERFRYQSEWRIVIGNGTGEALRLHLGSLETISTILPVEELNANITFTMDS